MNEFLPEIFAERVDRLLIGIEPVDAMRAMPVANPIAVVFDGNPGTAAARRTTRLTDDDWDRAFGIPDALGDLLPIPRSHSGRHALAFRPGLKTPPIALRLFDRRRRFVPRRISYPLPTDIRTASPRVRRPALYPGAAYDVSHAVTGLRGRVTWNAALADEELVRWARVEATIGDTVVGRAHGDDRGEFLLLLEANAGGLGDLPSPLRVQVTVFAPTLRPDPPGDDPLGDLPLEVLAADPDDISAGEKLPPGYIATASSSRSVDFELGRLLVKQLKFFINP
jgi:hypothetical protein